MWLKTLEKVFIDIFYLYIVYISFVMHCFTVIASKLHWNTLVAFY